MSMPTRAQSTGFPPYPRVLATGSTCGRECRMLTCTIAQQGGDMRTAGIPRIALPHLVARSEATRRSHAARQLDARPLLRRGVFLAMTTSALVATPGALAQPAS